jgi:hypothetical protein
MSGIVTPGHRNIWVEITKNFHQHGGKGWEFGTCLWSPSRNRAGHDRYSLMREPTKNDLVLHFYHNTYPDDVTETRISGKSIVKAPCKEIIEEPPNAGDWAGMSPYYRIELENYVSFKNPLPLNTLIDLYKDEIRREIIQSHPKFYPFNTHDESIRTVQGIYLAQCTSFLFLLIQNTLGLEIASNEEGSSEINPHDEYSEGLRKSRESYFWARNPKLVKDAKEFYGYNCQICGFNFEEIYGSIGKNFIECHHLHALSERPEDEGEEKVRTNLEDVRVLCSNCHRMVHRKKPPYSIEEIITMTNEIENRNSS